MTQEFKVGDTVEVVASRKQLEDFSCNSVIDTGDCRTITHIRGSEGSVKLDNLPCGWVKPGFIVHKKIHPHHDIIIAWLEGAEVQVRGKSDKSWRDVKKVANSTEFIPGFCKSNAYRIKPEKSQAEVELEELQKQIQKLTDQATKLAKEIKGE